MSNQGKNKSRRRAGKARLASKPVQLKTLIEEAETCLDAFNYDEAKEKLEAALKLDPNNVKSMEMLSSVYIERFNWEEAKNLLKRCIEMSPNVGYSKYFSMGQICEGLESVGLYEKGIEIIKKELEENENVVPSEENNRTTMLRNLSDAYCSVAELFMTDCCDEENAEEKCCSAIDYAMKADPSNPEALQCLANYELVKENFEGSKEAMAKSLALWLPQLEAMREDTLDMDLNSEIKLEKLIPSAESRLKTSKLLIELEMFSEAQKVLDGLIEDDDEVVEVWYLLGWLNYLQEDDEHKYNSHFYLQRAKEVSMQLGMEEDDCICHINELLEELKSTHPLNEDEEDGTVGNLSDYSTDSENDKMETT